LGLSILNHKSVMEMQFSDFVSCGFNQIVNNLAKTHYRWNQAADMVIRMPAGAGTAAGPFHSQSNEAWFFHTPGLKIVYPSSPYEAKGLLCAAIEDPNPVLFFESKALYRSLQGMVPQEYYTLPIGPADLKRRGDRLSIVTYGQAVHWAAQVLDETGIEADLIDLRSLLPWDKEMVLDSVKKTGKLLVLHEANLTGGVGAEIAATIAEEAFSFLDSPIMRLGGLDTPIPFNENLEEQYLPQNRLREAIEKLSRW
jgi:2-oxoisovalerate dehydrogenase E1 component